MKTFLITGGVAAVLLVGGIWWSQSMQANDPDVVSRGGIHWHPTLAVYIKGEKQEIPANIGVGPQYAGAPNYNPQMQMAAVHTHDDMPIIHLEFMNGPVREKDATLGQFFKIWGKEMREFGANMRMTVNGDMNTEYEQYMMRDGDVIELYYD